MIEADPTWDPHTVATAFAVCDGEGGLAEMAVLDTLVTVIDVSAARRALTSDTMLTERDPCADPGDRRSLAELFVDQVEIADVVVLNKADRVGPDEVARCDALIGHLNPRAVRLPATNGVVVPAQLVTGRFDQEQTLVPGWARALDVGPPPDRGDARTVVYRNRRPCHPARLYAALDNLLPEVVRSHGVIWLASRPDEMLEPAMAVVRLPLDAAPPLVLAAIRKDGVLLLDGVAPMLTSGQLLTAVFLAVTLLPCLVTALTIARERGVGIAGRWWRVRRSPRWWPAWRSRGARRCSGCDRC